MKIVETKVRQLVYRNNIEDFERSICEAAFVCYATPESKVRDYGTFIRDVLVSKDHARPLEFGTLYLSIPFLHYLFMPTVRKFVRYCKSNSLWSKVSVDFLGTYNITTNGRVPYEFFILQHGNQRVDVSTRLLSWSDSQNLYKRYWNVNAESEGFPRRHTFEYVCSRGAGDDLRTHISLSSVMQSTRYCNYAKEKFGKEIEYVFPKLRCEENEGLLEVSLMKSLKSNERAYMKLINECGAQPQEAKNVLGLGVKTVLRQCGFEEDFKNLIYRRFDSAAYPECVDIASGIKRFIRHIR